MTNRNRRSFVTTVGAIGTLGLAGCLSEGREAADDSTPAETPENTSSPSEEDDSTESSDDGSTTDAPSHEELAHLPGESISDFEDLGDWVSMIDSGTLEAETDDPYAGSQSAHLTAEEGTEYAGIYETIPGGEDLREKNLSLAVKFTGREQLQLTLQVLAPNSRNSLSLRRTLTGPTDRWVRVDFGATRVDTEPDLADVREIRLLARRRGNQEGEIDCSVDDLRAVDRPDSGAVTFLFDATLESHYTHAFDIMEEYGFAGVEAIIPEAVGRDGRLTLDAMSELDDAGWDMVARPRTGAQFLHEFTPEEQEGMVERTKRYLENRGFEDGANHFVTPRDVLGAESLDIVREHHEQAFRYGGGPNGLPLTDPHNIGVFSGDAGEETRAYVDHAAEYGQLAVLHFEHIGDDGTSEREFEELLEYVDDANVRVLTATEVLESA